MLATRTRRFIAAAIVAMMLAIASGVTVYAVNGRGGQSEVAKVRGAVAPYHNIEKATEAGWVLVPGLDYCFESEAGGMGIHHINPGLLDAEVDPLQPEALVYQHLANGNLQLGAVEYIVPFEAWHAEHGADAHAPMVLGQHMHRKSVEVRGDEPGAVDVYVLHAWLFAKNPGGMFEDFNPRFSCPAE